MKKPRVFIVQVPARRSGPRGQWVDKFDLSPAEEHGEVVRLLGYGNAPEDPEPTRRLLEEGLKDFDLSIDSLLLLGDPVACAQAVHVLAFTFGVPALNALKWDRREERYVPYTIG